MREDAFRAYLAPRLGGASVVASYLANARLVERRLAADLDQLDLSDAGIRAIRARLITHEVAPKKASDCASALRHYARMIDRPDPEVERPPRATLPPKQPVAVRTRHPLVTAATTTDLMRLYGDILAELSERGVSRTANGPVGDYAEYLFARAFEWTLAANSEGGFDARDRTGVRYQIKARRLGKPRTARQLSAIRRLPDRSFDVLALVLFDDAMAVLRAALVPHSIVAERASFIAHTNSWRLTAPDRLWTLPGVVDVTAALRGVA